MTTLSRNPDGRRYIGPAISVLIAAISLAISAFVAYARTDKDVSNRLTTVEVQQKNDKENSQKALERIERKLDNFIEYQTGRKP